MLTGDRESWTLTGAQCTALAEKYRRLAKAPNISDDRSYLLRNVARSLIGVAGQLDRLEAISRREESSCSRDPKHRTA